MDYLKFTQFLKNDFEYSNNKFKSIAFYRSDLILIFIWFFILEKYYTKSPYSLEELINDIPKKYASRPTIFKFINTAFKKRYLDKIKNPIDKRKFDLRPSKITIDEFEKWAKGFRGF
tara:strand:- start:748 stop:1098 length:351 start_codon:yes stop_codon:yes gene_type:complete